MYVCACAIHISDSVFTISTQQTMHLAISFSFHIKKRGGIVVVVVVVVAALLSHDKRLKRSSFCPHGHMMEIFSSMMNCFQNFIIELFFPHLLLSFSPSPSPSPPLLSFSPSPSPPLPSPLLPPQPNFLPHPLPSSDVVDHCLTLDVKPQRDKGLASKKGLIRALSTPCGGGTLSRRPRPSPPPPPCAATAPSLVHPPIRL